MVQIKDQSVPVCPNCDVARGEWHLYLQSEDGSISRVQCGTCEKWFDVTVHVSRTYDTQTIEPSQVAVDVGHHLTDDGYFQSDKYKDWCPKGFLALHLDDPLEQETALFYASRTKDLALADDLRTAVLNERKRSREALILELKSKSEYFK